MKHQYSTTTIWLAVLFVLSTSANVFAFQGFSPVLPSVVKENAKKRPPAKKQGRRGPGFFDIETNRFNIDAFIGAGYNMASGDYLAYQETYYQTGSETFVGTGSFSNFFAFNFGAQARMFPLHDNAGFISNLSVSLGVMYLKKGFSHDVQFQNKALKYEDVTTIKEEYNAHYLSTQLNLRLGKKIYIEGGVSLDILMGGTKVFDLVRSADSTETSTATPYKGPFVTGNKTTYTLTSEAMAGASLGWTFGAGFQVIPMFGVRFFNTYSTRFFKESNPLTNYQPSLQLIFTI